MEEGDLAGETSRHTSETDYVTSPDSEYLKQAGEAGETSELPSDIDYVTSPDSEYPTQAGEISTLPSETDYVTSPDSGYIRQQSGEAGEGSRLPSDIYFFIPPAYLNQPGETSRLPSEIDFFISPDSEYLKHHLGIPLTLGLAEIVSKKPTDPIHYLAHWLLKWRYNKEYDQVEKDKVMELTMERARVAEELAEKARIEAERQEALRREMEARENLEQMTLVVEELVHQSISQAEEQKKRVRIADVDEEFEVEPRLKSYEELDSQPQSDTNL